MTPRTDRTLDAVARAIDALARFPGHTFERALGLYTVGWGAVACAAPRMFEDGPRTYGALAKGADEWVYGLLFLFAGAAQFAFAQRVRCVGTWPRARFAATCAAGSLLAGLSLAFAHTGAWSGSYTYGFAAALDLLLLARLYVLIVAARRGYAVRTTYVVRATMAPPPSLPQ